MARTRPEGICHICGIFGQLSFEHVPPQAAFNNRAVVEQPIMDAMADGLDGRGHGRINQRGMGAYTLCESCNSKTGDWYASDFADWCVQGMDVLVRSDFNPKLIYLHYIYPLRVLKQIHSMVFSANSEGWRQKHPELEQFVLDRTRRWLNPQYRTFVYYTFEGSFRMVGNQMAVMNLHKGQHVIQVTEISHYPFGYVVMADGTCPDDRLYEITHFRRYAYDELEVAPLYLPVLPTHLPIPLDYRTRKEIEEGAAKGRAVKTRRRAGKQGVA